jgi:hypothetical protein
MVLCVEAEGTWLHDATSGNKTCIVPKDGGAVVEIPEAGKS